MKNGFQLIVGRCAICRLFTNTVLNQWDTMSSETWTGRYITMFKALVPIREKGRHDQFKNVLFNLGWIPIQI